MKAILIGLWGCLVALGSTYGSVIWSTAPVEKAEDKPKEQLDLVPTRGLSVPMIAEGKVQGYVVAHLAFTTPKDALKTMSISPELLILDEAFKAIYGTETIDFRNLQKPDLTALSDAIRDKINKRFGQRLIVDVLFEELNYVPADEVRGGRSGKRTASAPDNHGDAPKAKADSHGGGGHH